MMATKKLIEDQIEELSLIIQDVPDINNSLVRMFRSLKYELKNADRDKKVAKLTSMLNKKNHYRDRQELALFIHE